MRLRVVVAAVFGIGCVAVAFAGPASAGGGGCHLPPTDGAGTTVEFKDFCVTPTVLRVSPGATVTWVNRDATAHNVMGNGFYADLPTIGTITEQRFDAAGTYPYSCTLHASMNGAIVVGDGVGAAADRVVAVPTEQLIAASSDSAAAPVPSSSSSSSSGVPIPIAVVGAVAIAVAAALASWRLTRARPS